MRISKTQPICRPTARPRQKKLKSVTFTGCWTCRSRKIKCDERQTDGCRVCQKSGLECAGYGVNLCWVTDKKQSKQGQRRRMMKFDRTTLPIIQDSEIDSILSAIDTISARWKTVVLGPFGIFQPQSASPQDTAATAVEAGDCNLPSKAVVDDNLPDKSSYDKATIFSGSNESSINDIELNPSVCSPVDKQIAINPRASHPSPYHNLTTFMSRNEDVSFLLHHYEKHVADLLQPVFHHENPWRTTYFPFALRGCSDSFIIQNSHQPSGVFSSLFHSLLSAAAFHLRNLLGGSPKYHKIGLQHKAKALNALNSGLITPAGPEYYTVYLTAMLALVTIDTITGEDSDFPIHLNGCGRLLRSRLDRQILGGPTRQVKSICHFLSLLTRTTAYNTEPSISRTDDDFLESIHFDVDDRGIEYMYGITPTLGNLLKRTCQAAGRLSIYQNEGIPVFLLKECTEIEYEIAIWNIESEKIYAMGSTEHTMREIVCCQARAFHSAMAIFYYRTIGTSSTVNMENHVQIIWENLKLAEDLKEEYLNGDKRSAPMSWPAFIAACEASDREPWVKWWERVQIYGLGNFTRQWRTIQEVWSLMDDYDDVGSWREALRRSGRLVLPI